MSSKWIFPAGLILVLFVAFFFYNKYHVPPKVDFGKLVLTNMEGGEVNFSSFNGKKTVVCFSASWCGACLQELNDLKELKEKELADVQIIIIDDESLDKTKAFREQNNYPFIFLKMLGSFAELGVHSIPASYILNDKLQVVKETVGFINWKDLSTRQHLMKMMEVTI